MSGAGVVTLADPQPTSVVVTEDRLERLFAEVPVRRFWVDGPDHIWRLAGGVTIAYDTRRDQWRGYFR